MGLNLPKRHSVANSWHCCLSIAGINKAFRAQGERSYDKFWRGSYGHVFSRYLVRHASSLFPLTLRYANNIPKLSVILSRQAWFCMSSMHSQKIFCHINSTHDENFIFLIRNQIRCSWFVCTKGSQWLLCNLASWHLFLLSLMVPVASTPGHRFLKN